MPQRPFRPISFGYGVLYQIGKALCPPCRVLVVFAVALISLSALLASGPARAEGKVHVLALGDSLTAGYGLMDHEGFVPQLTKWLAARGHDVRVVNGGVSGDTSAGGLARLEWSLSPEMGGLIVALGANDMLRGTDPAVTRANITGVLDIAQARGLKVLLIGIRAPGNYGPEWQAEFNAIWPDLAAQYAVPMVPSFFIGVEGMDSADVADLLQADGLHPTTEGVARIVEGLGPFVETLVTSIAR